MCSLLPTYDARPASRVRSTPAGGATIRRRSGCRRLVARIYRLWRSLLTLPPPSHTTSRTNVGRTTLDEPACRGLPIAPRWARWAVHRFATHHFTLDEVVCSEHDITGYGPAGAAAPRPGDHPSPAVYPRARLHPLIVGRDTRYAQRPVANRPVSVSAVATSSPLSGCVALGSADGAVSIRAPRPISMIRRSASTCVPTSLAAFRSETSTASGLCSFSSLRRTYSSRGRPWRRGSRACAGLQCPLPGGGARRPTGPGPCGGSGRWPGPRSWASTGAR